MCVVLWFCAHYDNQPEFSRWKTTKQFYGLWTLFQWFIMNENWPPQLNNNTTNTWHCQFCLFHLLTQRPVFHDQKKIARSSEWKVCGSHLFTIRCGDSRRYCPQTLPSPLSATFFLRTILLFKTHTPTQPTPNLI